MKNFEDMTFDEKIAEAARRDECRRKGIPLTPSQLEIEKRSKEEDARLEKEIQLEVMDNLRAYGFTVYSLSQARASKQTPGLSDVIAIHPWRRRLLFFETKTPTGEQSPDQVEFQVLIVQLAVLEVQYVAGGVKAVEEYLISIGSAERTASGGIEPTLRR